MTLCSYDYQLNPAFLEYSLNKKTLNLANNQEFTNSKTGDTFFNNKLLKNQTSLRFQLSEKRKAKKLDNSESSENLDKKFKAVYGSGVFEKFDKNNSQSNISSEKTPVNMFKYGL